MATATPVPAPSPIPKIDWPTTTPLSPEPPPLPTPDAPPATSGWLTSEFWATIASTLGNLIAVFTVTGIVSSTDATTLNDNLTAAITGLGAFVINGAVLWKYISSRLTIAQTMAEQSTTRHVAYCNAHVRQLAVRERSALRMAKMQLNMMQPPSGNDPTH